jgi:hypothetical protein
MVSANAAASEKEKTQALLNPVVGDCLVCVLYGTILTLGILWGVVLVTSTI